MWTAMVLSVAVKQLGSFRAAGYRKLLLQRCVVFTCFHYAQIFLDLLEMPIQLMVI